MTRRDFCCLKLFRYGPSCRITYSTHSLVFLSNMFKSFIVNFDYLEADFVLNFLVKADGVSYIFGLIHHRK